MSEPAIRPILKMSYSIPVSIELLLDTRGDFFGRKPGTYTYGWEPWLAKEWFKRGHGEGKRGPKGKLP